MLEIVITGRNDDFGGADFIDRLCAAAARNHERLQAAGVAHTFTLAEWNPPPGRPLLAEIVTSRLPFWGRAWVADPEWHRRLSTNPRLQFMEFFAKNAALRRSCADAILTTNSDVFLSEELVARLARISWREETVYRATRYDIDRTIEWRAVPEAVFADPARHVRVQHLAGPEFGNAAGDFLLLARATFHRLRGFNETVRYAKLHKDGQFCFRAWIEGLAVEPLGPIWHIDHDGSYANAGAGFGSPDAPYGPEWNYRVDYRNPASWGLSPAIEEPVDACITWLRHPCTHGPTISVIASMPRPDDPPPVEAPSRADCECLTVAGAWSDTAALNDALAGARGQFVFVAGRRALAAAELDSLVAFVRERHPDLFGIAGACSVGADGLVSRDRDTAFGFSRRAYETVGECRELSFDATGDFWTRAAETTTPAVWHPPGGRDWWLGDGGVADKFATAARRLASVLADSTGSAAQWVKTLALEPGAPVAVLGPDWATPFLVAGARAAGHPLAALVSIDPSECGTHQHGERVEALDALAGRQVAALLASSTTRSVTERLARVGFGGIVAAWFPKELQSLAPVVPSELALRRARQAEALAANDLDAALERLPALCVLEGTRQFGHRYDAALLADRLGRGEEALRLFAGAASPHNPDAALRMRATFHEGRLLLAAGRASEALDRLDYVLEHTPGHVRALALAREGTRRFPDVHVPDRLRARLAAGEP